MSVNWKALGKTIASTGATILGTAVGGPAGPAIGAIVASALGCEENPDAISEAVKTNPEAAIKLKEIESQNELRLQEMILAHETATIHEVNTTMRAETDANDAYVRRWRPTFGYCVALSWFSMMICVSWSIVDTPEQAPAIISALTATSTLWGVALAVLGVSVHKRSQDKKINK